MQTLPTHPTEWASYRVRLPPYSTRPTRSRKRGAVPGRIRSKKHGHIIWDGLREVTVKTTNEVMSLIKQGTSIRRTNETDMNAQSSRSHAIFLFNLDAAKILRLWSTPRVHQHQYKLVDSPSRLARPASTYASTSANRVSSPTFGRPPTPSFATAMGRGGGLRPSSALGIHSETKKGCRR